MEIDQLKNLLRRYFEGTLTQAQMHLLREALADPVNQHAYYDFVHEWELGNPQILPDTEADWLALSGRLNQPGSLRTVAPTWRPLIWSSRYWVAAALLVAALTGYWKRDLLLYHHYHTGYGSTKSVRLPDGSAITLNANSDLKFSRFPALTGQREAFLKGEAAFSVTHLSDHTPFVVKTEDSLQVSVLGTDFLVYSRRERSKIVLTEGAIQLRSLKSGGAPLLVKPGQVVNVNSRGDFAVSQSPRPAEHFCWKDDRFFFDNTSLGEIGEQLQERFGIRLLIPDSALAATAISGNYPAANAEEVVRMLSTILNLRYSRPHPHEILLQKNLNFQL